MKFFTRSALAVCITAGSATVLSGPLGDTVNSLGLTGIVNETTSTVSGGLGSALEGVGGDSMADADVLSPADGNGTLDADAFSSTTLLGLTPVASTDDTGAGSPTLPVTGDMISSPLSGALQGLAGSEGGVTGVVTGLSDGLQETVKPVTDALATTGLEAQTSDLDAANVSVGTLDIGSNSDNTLLDADALNTDTGSQGDIGIGVLSDGASGTGDLTGISVVGGDNAGSGGLAGISVIGGDNSGSGDLVGAAVIGGDANGSGGLAGAGILTGDDSGTSDTIGTGVISGDNSGTGGLAGAAVLSGEGSGNGLISANALTSKASGGENTPGYDASNPGVDRGQENMTVDVLPFVFEQTDSARYAMSCAGPDSDADGVCDQEDRCPNTPKEAAVLTSGCHLGANTPLILQGVRFAFDSAQLTRASAAELYHAIKVLKQNPGLSIEVAGHTDDKGSDEYNARLSKARAESVYRVLLANGIQPERLSVRGYGRSQPIAANTTVDGQWDLAGMAQNRRVEFRIENKQVSQR